MKTKVAIVIGAMSMLALSAGAEAKGCLKGAVVGAIGGHVAGRHGVAGAAAGCAAGHYIAKRKDEEKRQAEIAAQRPPTRTEQGTRDKPASQRL